MATIREAARLIEANAFLHAERERERRRRRGEPPTYALVRDVVAAPDYAALHERLLDLEDALDALRLSDRARAAVWEVLVEGYTEQEAARRHGVSRRSIWAVKGRVRAFFRVSTSRTR